MQESVTRRIGVFGGSFNPVHTGHLVMGQDLLEAYELDEVVFVPCGNPPHKDVAEFAPAEHRKAMLELVSEIDDRFSVSDVELDRAGFSYTIDTLNELQSVLAGDQLFFMIGSDTLPELYTWHRIEDMLETYSILPLVRPGFDSPDLAKMDFQLPEGWRERLLENLVRGHHMDISASDIRMRVAEGMCIRYLVPPEVEMYISEHRLYQ